MSIGTIAALTYIGCVAGMIIGLFIFAVCGLYIFLEWLKDYLSDR